MCGMMVVIDPGGLTVRHYACACDFVFAVESGGAGERSDGKFVGYCHWH
jgi:hypothetical protein